MKKIMVVVMVVLAAIIGGANKAYAYEYETEVKEVVDDFVDVIPDGYRIISHQEVSVVSYYYDVYNTGDRVDEIMVTATLCYNGDEITMCYGGTIDEFRMTSIGLRILSTYSAIVGAL